MNKYTDTYMQGAYGSDGNQGSIYQKGMPIFDVDTPSIIVDLDVAEKNIKNMQDFANSQNVSMRPHSKTNKSPYWAKKQIAQGAIGICCAKLGEAEQMAASGIKEILIPNQIVGKSKIQRLVDVNKISKVIVAVENEQNLEDLSEAFVKDSRTLSVIVEVNVGMDRCGVELDEIIEFVKLINSLTLDIWLLVFSLLFEIKKKFG